MKKFIAEVLQTILPRSIQLKIFHLGAQLVPDRFSEFAFEYANAPDMERALGRLEQRGFQPRSILDIGAFEGEFCKMARRIWPQAKIQMFEANPSKKTLLEEVAAQNNAELQLALLGPKTGEEVTFNVMESGSSVFEENSPRHREKVTLKTTRLDDAVADETYDFLKLDVQGFELQVLNGAKRLIANASAVMLEVSFIEINQNAPLFAEVVGYMKAEGFEVADIMDIHRRPLDKATNQVDLMFVRPESPLLADTRHYA